MFSAFSNFFGRNQSQEVDDHVDLTLIQKLKVKLFFTQGRQFEFLDNYLSLKGVGEKQLSDKSVFEGIRDVYTDTVSAGCIEVLVCENLLEVIENGRNMAEGFEPFLNSKIVMAFRATYKVGRTDYGVRQVIKNIKEQSELRTVFRKRIQSGLMFFGSGLAAVTIISSQFLPMMIAMVNTENVDGLTLFYKDMGEFINLYSYNIFVGVLVVSILFFISLSRWNGTARDIADKFFLYAIYQSFSANQFFNMLTLLKNGGLSLRQGLEAIYDDSTPYMQHHLDQMLEMTRTGSSNLEQLNTGLLPPRLQVRLKIAGANGTSLDGAFEVIAEAASTDVAKKLNTISGTIKFWLMISGISMLAVSIMVILNILVGIAMGG